MYLRGPALAKGIWFRVALAAFVALGVIGSLVFGAHTPALYLLYVSVALGAVTFGWREAMVLAVMCVILVATPMIIHGLHQLAPDAPGQRGALLNFASWAVSLLSTAVMAGVASEHAGNARLMKRLAAGTSAALERERKRMSFDIHDGIAQEAATALMEIEILRSIAGKVPGETGRELQQQVAGIHATLSALLQETRSMIGQLRPPPLAASQFHTTLGQLIEDFESRTGVEVDFHTEGDLSLHTDSMRICVYRVTQEALANIEHHAHPSMVRVDIRATRSGVHFEISDDGEGFDPAILCDSSTDRHLGLKGMEDRIANLGGRLEVIAKPGLGTAIRAYCPGCSA